MLSKEVAEIDDGMTVHQIQARRHCSNSCIASDVGDSREHQSYALRRWEVRLDILKAGSYMRTMSRQTQYRECIQVSCVPVSDLLVIFCTQQSRQNVVVRMNGDDW